MGEWGDEEGESGDGGRGTRTSRGGGNRVEGEEERRGEE